MNLARQLEELFYAKIPITRALGVTAEDFDGDRLVLAAPLGENVNHLGTAFGGSLNTLAVLSCYGVLWLELREEGCNIIIRDSTIHYHRPVRGDIRAVCARPDEKAVETFKRRFRQRGQSRIVLSATIEDEGRTAARFRGTFAALR